MINDRDLALIAQLADGSIDPADEAAARALLDSSAAARAEYESQTIALEAIRMAGPAQMTPGERSQLRAGLIDQLGLEVVPDPEPARRRRAVPWGGLAVAAAALIGVIALAPVLSLLSTDGGSSDATTVALTAPAAAAEDEVARTEAGAGSDFGAELPSAALPRATAPAPAAPATTTTAPAFDAAAATTTAAQITEEATLFLYSLGALEETDIDELNDVLLRFAGDPLSLVGALRRIEGTVPATAVDLERFDSQGGCLDTIPEELSTLPLGFGEVLESTVIVYQVTNTDTGEGPFIYLVDLETCEQVLGSDDG